jgi:uncharacterized membrane protein YpjA
MPSARDRFVDFFGFFKEHRAWAALIALVNLVGIAYGFYYYGQQFAATPPWLWWLVPDSPLAVLWAELALAAYWLLPRGRSARWLWLDALAFVGNVQVGLWTCYVLLAYEPHFHTLDFLQGEGPIHLNTVLWVGHFGMAALALIYVKGLREARAWWAVGVAAAYYLLNDVVDYFGPDFLGNGCGMRPYTVPCIAGQEGTLAAVTFGLTLASTGALLWLMRPASNVGRT